MLWTRGHGHDGLERMDVGPTSQQHPHMHNLVPFANLPRLVFSSSSTHSYILSLPGMQPRLTSIAAAGGAQAVCFYDLTLGG